MKRRRIKKRIKRKIKRKFQQVGIILTGLLMIGLILNTIYVQISYYNINQELIAYQITSYDTTNFLIKNSTLKTMQSDLDKQITKYTDMLSQVSPLVQNYGLKLDTELNVVEQYDLISTQILEAQEKKILEINQLTQENITLTEDFNANEMLIYVTMVEFYSQNGGNISPSNYDISLTQTCNPVIVDGILLANKVYCLPKDYDPGIDPESEQKQQEMFIAAEKDGMYLKTTSEYRSYAEQEEIYQACVLENGMATANTMCAIPGFSEHQTGLAFDVGCSTCGETPFGYTSESVWLAENAHRFGFIIRYPEGLEDITGYEYEPWHIRYVGVDVATSIYESGVTLEEYLILK